MESDGWSRIRHVRQLYATILAYNWRNMERIRASRNAILSIFLVFLETISIGSAL